MLGALFGLVTLGVLVKERISDIGYEEQGKEKALQSGSLYYLDSHGRKRSCLTDNLAYSDVDKDGYEIIVDSKTKEILNDSDRQNEINEREQAKARAMRSGMDTYSYYKTIRDMNNMPKKVYVTKLVFNDKDVGKTISGTGYGDPEYGLALGKYGKDYNRRYIYEYFRNWYIAGGKTFTTIMGHAYNADPREMLKTVEEYNIDIYREDFDYCMKKLQEGIDSNWTKPVFSYFWFNDEDYRYADWAKEMR